MDISVEGRVGAVMPSIDVPLQDLSVLYPSAACVWCAASDTSCLGWHHRLYQVAQAPSPVPLSLLDTSAGVERGHP